MKDNQQNQLFTELTPEQASIVEGGAWLQIGALYSEYTGADPDSGDDAYIEVNGKKLWGTKEFNGKMSYSVDKGIFFKDYAFINVIDKDDSSNQLVGYGHMSEHNNLGSWVKLNSANGSQYWIYYQMTA